MCDKISIRTRDYPMKTKRGSQFTELWRYQIEWTQKTWGCLRSIREFREFQTFEDGGALTKEVGSSAIDREWFQLGLEPLFESDGLDRPFLGRTGSLSNINESLQIRIIL